MLGRLLACCVLLAVASNLAETNNHNAWSILTFANALPTPPPSLLYGGTDPFGVRLEHVGKVMPFHVHLRLRSQFMEYGAISPFVLESSQGIAEPSSTFPGDEQNQRVLFSGSDRGEPSTILAFLAGPVIRHANGTISGKRKEFDVVHGSALNTVWADTAANYELRSVSAPGFATAQVPVSVSRKSIMYQFGYPGAYWDNSATAESSGAAKTFSWTMKHDITLEFATAPVFGHDYVLAFVGVDADENSTLSGKEVRVSLQNEALVRSDAIHVNQQGFLPAAGTKRAYISWWSGVAGGISAPSLMSWRVARADTGAMVASANSPIQLRKSSTSEEHSSGSNFQLTDLYDMDLVSNISSALPLDTDLVVAVEGVGSSAPFRISKGAYERALAAVLRVFWYQRNGVELRGSWEGYDFFRPRALYPGDVPVFYTNVSLAEVGNSDIGGYSDPVGFSSIAAAATTTPCTAYGGWQDAGDWDTRSPHFYAARQLLMLLDRFPSVFGLLDLGIPCESGDSVPDILQQALFLIESYERFQNQEGGVSGGMETVGHPIFGDVSFDNSQTWFCYREDPWTTFHFASTAAFAARLLKPYQPARAAELAFKARLAYSWADAHFDDVQVGASAVRYGNRLRAERATATVHLLALGGAPNATLSAAFAADSLCGGTIVGGNNEDQMESAFQFATLDSSIANNAPLQASCAASIRAIASIIEMAVDTTGFRVGLATFMPQMSVPANVLVASLIYDIQIRGLSAARASLDRLGLVLDFGFGANPMNMQYVTDGGIDGLFGSRAFRHPLRVDSFNTGETAPPGITVIGPLNPNGTVSKNAGIPISYSYQFFPNLPNPVEPSDTKWPFFEYFVEGAWILMGEYTPHSTLGQQALQLGFYIGAMQELNEATTRSYTAPCPGSTGAVSTAAFPTTSLSSASSSTSTGSLSITLTGSNATTSSAPPMGFRGSSIFSVLVTVFLGLTSLFAW